MAIVWETMKNGTYQQIRVTIFFFSSSLLLFSFCSQSPYFRHCTMNVSYLLPKRKFLSKIVKFNIQIRRMNIERTTAVKNISIRFYQFVISFPVHVFTFKLFLFEFFFFFHFSKYVRDTRVRYIGQEITQKKLHVSALTFALGKPDLKVILRETVKWCFYFRHSVCLFVAAFVPYVFRKVLEKSYFRCVT